ncbi:MAG: PspA/IM30 family protein [Polyangiaceae bacterium]|nr:PspA/IM30 family protein [Polyangiaceae bacterium]
MGLIDRFGKLVSSNMNALLDKAEDPEKSVNLLIEEMRCEIKKGRQDVAGAVATEKQLRTRIDDIDQQIEKWQRRAELALTAGDEPLAREALLYKKRLVGDRDRAEANRAAHRTQTLQMRDDLERAEAKLKELEAKKGTIVTKYKQARAGGGVEALGASAGSPTPFDELRRMEEKLERANYENAALEEARDMLNKPTGSQMSSLDIESQFATLERHAPVDNNTNNNTVNNELDASRKRFRVPT